jgi:hypothetical protein
MATILEAIAKKAKEITPQFIDEEKVRPTTQGSRVLESAQLLGEEAREKVGGRIVSATESIPKTTFGIFEGISRIVGAAAQRAPGILQVPEEEREPFLPKEGETLSEVIRRQPLFGELVTEKIEKTPLGKIPGVAPVAGFLSEFLLPPYGAGKGASFVDDIARLTTKAEVKSVLLKGLRGVSEKEADDLAIKLAPIKDNKIIQKELENFVAQKPIPFELTELVPAPIKKLPIQKERGFVTSAKEVIPEAEKIAGQYIPRSTDTLAIKAKNLIKDDIIAAERLALEGSSDEAVALFGKSDRNYGSCHEKCPL